MRNSKQDSKKGVEERSMNQDRLGSFLFLNGMSSMSGRQ